MRYNEYANVPADRKVATVACFGAMLKIGPQVSPPCPAYFLTASPRLLHCRGFVEESRQNERSVRLSQQHVIGRVLEYMPPRPGVSTYSEPKPRPRRSGCQPRLVANGHLCPISTTRRFQHDEVHWAGFGNAEAHQ
jgi:hypothetical protein